MSSNASLTDRQLGCLVIVAVIGLLVLFNNLISNRSQDSIAPTPTMVAVAATATPPPMANLRPTSVPAALVTHTLDATSEEYIPLAASQGVSDAYWAAELNHQDTGNILMSGQITAVVLSTSTVRVEQSDGSHSLVRVVGGPDDNRAGWVPTFVIR